MVVEQPELGTIGRGLLEVVADDLRLLALADAGLGLEPLRESLVQLRAAALEDALVGLVADEDVEEAIGTLVAKGRARRRDELLASERCKEATEATARLALIQRGDCRRVEDLTHDRGPFQGRPLIGTKAIESSRQQRGDGRRHRDLAQVAGRAPATSDRLDGPVIDEHREHLFDVERVAAGGLDDALLGHVVDRGIAQQVRDDLAALGRGQRLERHAPPWRGIAAIPVGMVLEQFRARRADDDDRCLDRIGEVRDEVEEGLLGPMEVVDDDDQRPAGRDRLDQPARRPECLFDRERARGQPDGGLEPLRHSAVGGEHRPDPLARGLRRILVGDAGCLPDHLGQRPERDALAVRQAPAAQDRDAVGAAHELLQQARLPDAGWSEDRHEPGPASSGRFGKGGVQGRQFGPAPDHRGIRPSSDALLTGRAKQLVGGHGLRLALERQRLDRLDLDGIAHQSPGRFAQQHLVRRRGLLQTGGGVDHVTRDQSLPGGHLARDDLAGVDPGPIGQADAPARLEVGVDDGERLAHLPGRSDGTQGVVLVQTGQAEDGHDRVADELLDRPPVSLEDGLHLAEVDVQDFAQALAVEPLAQRGRALQVAEHDGDGLADLMRRCCCDEGRAAEAAEPELLRVLFAAVRAPDHPASLAGCGRQARADAWPGIRRGGADRLGADRWGQPRPLGSPTGRRTLMMIFFLSLSTDTTHGGVFAGDVFEQSCR